MSAKRKALRRYQDKRDFRRTPEPQGGSKSKRSDRPIFVIQHHDASSDHYDFRLEIDGVLKSWAVPKGPSTDPREKRLAVATEDHPLDYAGFEGTIPEDEYGGGAVLVWDRGAFGNLKTGDDGEPVPLTDQYHDGHLTVELHGEKLRGGYALTRTDGDRWLLVKMRDAGADARRRPVSTQPKSVLTGRTLAEIAESAD